MRNIDLPESIPTDAASLPGLVSLLARELLDGESAPFAWPGEVLEACGRLEFCRLLGARAAPRDANPQLPLAALSGAVAVNHPFAFLLASDGEQVTLGVGSHPQSAESFGCAAAAMLGAPTPTPLQLRHD